MATGRILETDLVIMSLGQVMRKTPELAPPSPTYNTNWRTLSLDKFFLLRRPLHGGSSVAIELELATHKPRVRNHNHKATAASNKREYMLDVNNKMR
ncbi:hypothetical protein TNCV_3574801 [Trichonephila clavipes]|nr:hypothetical protein TNCV_3574801 [Trichonephila clavipes]